VSSGVSGFNNLVVFRQIGIRLDGVHPELGLDHFRRDQRT
jgi:hypothetical protein